MPMKNAMKRKLTMAAMIGSLSLAPLAGLTGCESLPGDKKTQGAVIGGLGGAAAGALIGKGNPVLGAIIGGALGAGGGYLIGSQLGKADHNHRDDAIRASEMAERNPATVDDVRRSKTADLNGDGYVTMDEVVAMEKAGLSKNEQIRRLEATGQFFELTPQQEDYLAERGVSRDVISAMRTMNQDTYRQARDRVGVGDRNSNYPDDTRHRDIERGRY